MSLPLSHTPSSSTVSTPPVAALLVVVLVVVSPSPSFGDESETADSRTEDSAETTEDDETVAVRTVDRPGMQRDDERFPSGLATRIATDDLNFRNRDLGDAVSQVPGVYVRRRSSRGQPAYVGIRGGSSRQMVARLDGLRLSSPIGAGFDAGTMATGGIGSVDVHRGSGSATHGAGALTGALELHPAQAPEEGVEWMARSRGGSFGTAGLDAAAGVAGRDVGLRVHGGLERSDGDFGFVDDQGVGHRRENNDHRRANIGATGHVETDDHRLRTTGMFQTGEAGRPGPSEFQQTFDDARATHRDGLVTMRWDGRRLVKRPGLLVDGLATAGVRQRDHRYHNPEGVLTGVAFESRSTTRTAAATGGLRALIGDDHLARLDVEQRLETHTGVTRGVDESRLAARRYTSAISISDQWLLADDAISLVGAVRAEYTDGDDQTSFRPLLPSLGAVVRAHPRLEFRANVSRTFRAPGFDELYLDTETVRGNPGLDPEEAWTTDASVRLGSDEDPLRARVTGFYNAIDSTILFLPVSSRLFEARSLRGAEAGGLEVGLDSTIADRWHLRAGYTWTRARLEGDGSDRPAQLPGRPRHRLTLESTLDLTGLSFWSRLPEVSIQPAARYRSRVNLDHFGHLTNAPTLMADIGATLGVTSRIRVGVEVKNLLDERRAQDSLYRPLPGRSLYGTLEITGGGGSPQ